MKAEESRALTRWYILGAVGGVLMAAGDWLLGCVPLQATDTGMFNRAYYLSGVPMACGGPWPSWGWGPSSASSTILWSKR